MRAFWGIIAILVAAAALSPGLVRAGSCSATSTHCAQPPAAQLAVAPVIEGPPDPATITLQSERGDLVRDDGNVRDAGAVVTRNARAQVPSSGCNTVPGSHNDLLTGLLIALGCALFAAALCRLPNG